VPSLAFPRSPPLVTRAGIFFPPVSMSVLFSTTIWYSLFFSPLQRFFFAFFFPSLIQWTFPSAPRPRCRFRFPPPHRTPPSSPPPPRAPGVSSPQFKLFSLTKLSSLEAFPPPKTPCRYGLPPWLKVSPALFFLPQETQSFSPTRPLDS